MLPCGEIHRAVFKGLNADLGAFGVQNGGHGNAQTVPDVLEAGQGGKVGLMGSVGEIEACGVHAVDDQRLQHLLAVAGRAEGTDDFGFSHISCLQFG